MSLIVKSLWSRENIFQEQREPVSCLTVFAFMQHEEGGTDWERAFRSPCALSVREAGVEQEAWLEGAEPQTLTSICCWFFLIPTPR